jgi:hypothetical protein
LRKELAIVARPWVAGRMTGDCEARICSPKKPH